MLLKLQKFKC